MARAFLGIGSNQGDREQMISRAVNELAHAAGVRVLELAPIIQTAPVGGPEQPEYLNTVVAIETSIEPASLLRLLKDIERRLGRTPGGPRWGPRPIDLDILVIDEVIMSTPELTVPHPRMHDRRFVLEPLAHLAPDLMHPVLKRSVAALLEDCAGAAAAGEPSGGPEA